MSKQAKGTRCIQKKKVKILSPEIRKLTCEELTHFIKNGHEASCKTCLKVWKAYGYKEPPKWGIKKYEGKTKGTVEQNIETKLLRD